MFPDYGYDIDDVIVMWLSKDYGNNLDKHDRWFHGRETFSASLVLCEWNPPVTYGIPSQWSHYAIMFFFLFWRTPEQTIEQAVELPMILDAMTSLQWNNITQAKTGVNHRLIRC